MCTHYFGKQFSCAFFSLHAHAPFFHGLTTCILYSGETVTCTLLRLVLILYLPTQIHMCVIYPHVRSVI